MRVIDCIDHQLCHLHRSRPSSEMWARGEICSVRACWDSKRYLMEARNNGRWVWYITVLIAARQHATSSHLRIFVEQRGTSRFTIFVGSLYTPDTHLYYNAVPDSPQGCESQWWMLSNALLIRRPPPGCKLFFFFPMYSFKVQISSILMDKQNGHLLVITDDSFYCVLCDHCLSKGNCC